MFAGLDLNIDTMAQAISVLTAMITPALLISATGTFILSTSTRLARVVDRTRLLTERIEQLSSSREEVALREERLALWKGQLKTQFQRLKLLRQALTLLYVAATVFIFTSVAIGVVWASGLRYYWIPVVMGIGGASCLLGASVLLVMETRKAVTNAAEETSFVIRLVEAQGETAAGRQKGEEG